MREPLTAHQANDVYDILVEHAGADDTRHEDRYDSRTDFVFAQTDSHCSEYRFMGSLGFGGKFRRNGWDDRWHVSCYAEDLTPQRQEAIDATNTALVALKQNADHEQL